MSELPKEKVEQKMSTLSRWLHKAEYQLCLWVWAGSVIYSLYSYFFYSIKIQPVLDKSDFQRGWFRGRLKDISDQEWTVISRLFLKYLYLVFGHLWISQFFQIFLPKYFVHFIIVYGSIFIISIFSFTAYLFLLFNVVIVLMIHLRLQKLFAYLFLFFALFSVSLPDFADLKDYLFEKDAHRKFLFDVAYVWLNARLLSFNLDRLEEQKHTDEHYQDFEFDLIFARVKRIRREEYLSIFAYLLFVPTFFTGPLNHYAPFVKDLKQMKPWSSERAYWLLMRVLKYVFWIFVFEVALHYFYTTAIQYYPTLLYSLDAWTLSGFGYSLPCLFFLKYFIIYGLANTLAELDQIQVPGPPMCVTRIHSSSLLWRYFDRGLYFWLKDYFYKPMISGNYNYINKISASFICFTYVCLWHRMEDSAIIWCTINFVVIVIEQTFIYYLEENKLLKHYVGKLSAANRTRLNALISAPFFSIMIISNIYFLSNVEVGSYFFSRVMFKWPVPALPLLAIMYCGCFYSISRGTDLKSGIRKMSSHTE